MSEDDGELPIPTWAQKGGGGIELARIWAAEGKQHLTIRTDIWEDPACWGMMLVDLAKHAANAYAQEDGRDAAAVLERIKEGFDAEWVRSTDGPEVG